ncbi:hypothetical protein, partial [Paenibacillus riograndensis]
NKAFRLEGDLEAGNPAQAAAAAVGQVIDLEHEGIHVSVLDMNKEDYPSGREFAAALHTSLLLRADGESVTAIRSGTAYSRSLERMPEQAAGEVFEPCSGETYLITGGTG